MYEYKRARVDLDADTHETFRYFALLRGVPVGAALRRVLALHAQTIEKEFPPIRAHMLAWRTAVDMQRAMPVAHSEWDTPLERAEAAIAEQQGDSLDEVPF